MNIRYSDNLLKSYIQKYSSSRAYFRLHFCSIYAKQAEKDTKVYSKYCPRMVGFDARNKEEISSLYLCRSCNLILREPFQLNCGHRQCKTCTQSIEGEMIKCAECSEETPKNEIMADRGFRNDMKQLSIICSLCEWNGLFNDYEKHLNQRHPPVCEYCAATFNSTIRLDEHKQKECTKITIPCVLKDYGCLSSVYQVRMGQHYLTDIHRKAIANIPSNIGPKPPNEQHEKVSTMDVDVGQGGASSMITTTNENIQHLSSVSSPLLTEMEPFAQKFAALKLGIQEQSPFSGGIERNENSSYDGTYIWKITDFHEKMMDAQSGRQTSIYSPAFYSLLNGYKMCARLYLHGDGNARGTHMSLFFVLMRGDYDAMLKFPFDFKVTFCLYDQTRQRRHIIDSFRPDINSDSFQRPRSEMNIASGIPKFCPLAMIQQEGNPYVRDDTMLIEVKVDLGLNQNHFHRVHRALILAYEWMFDKR